MKISRKADLAMAWCTDKGCRFEAVRIIEGRPDQVHFKLGGFYSYIDLDDVVEYVVDSYIKEQQRLD